MSRYARRTASVVVRPNITSSFEYPKTNASFLSIRVTSTSSPSASDKRVPSSRPPKPAPRTTTRVFTGRSCQPRRATQAGAPAVPAPGLGRRLLVDVESRLLGWSREATFDALRHPGHQDIVAEPLPALLRVVDRDDRPAVRRRAGCVKELTVR